MSAIARQTPRSAQTPRGGRKRGGARRIRPSCLVAIVLAATLIASSAGVGAEPLPEEISENPQLSVELDLETALAFAEMESPRLRAVESQVEGARFGVVTARQYPNPEAIASSGRQIGREPGNPNGVLGVVEIAQPIDLPTVRRPRIRGAEAGVTGSEHALAETRLVVRANVKQAFFDALRRRAEFALAGKNEQVFQDIRDRVALQHAVGEVPRFELTRADAELSVAVNTTNSARLRVAQAIAMLRAAVGVPLPAELQPVGELPEPPVLPPIEVLRREVLERYPAIARADAAVARARAQLQQERALRFAQPSVRAGFEREPQIENYRVGISIPIPIFNQRRGQIGEAEAALQQANLAAELVRIEVRAAIDAAHGRYEVARAQIAQFEGGLLRQAESALAVAEAAFRFGERGFIDVLDAQRVLRNVRNDFLTARFDRQSALIEIERLRAVSPEAPQP
ncbi:TolC family protein [Myxococcota bacterium]|nr:TolC family protein [Myxococcota bacterium]